MNAIDLIRDLRGELDRVKRQGQPVVTVAALEQYLAAQEATATGSEDAERSLSKAKHDLEVWKVRAPLEHATSLEAIRWAIQAGGDALRALVLINGGAAVALLAFLGNVLTKEPTKGTTFSVANMKVAMVTFVFGVGFGGVSYAGRYLTQFTSSLGRHKLAYVFNSVAIALGLLSLAAFFRGGLWAYWSFG
jgi:hypothetical protein